MLLRPRRERERWRVLAAVRAELLVLRKWPAAWGLLLVVPAATLLPYYVVSFVFYLTVTPAEYAQQGNPTMILPSLLPSQFVIVSLTLLPVTTAPFVVLGAVMAGGDWERGTIGTSLLAGTGRVRTAAGQAVALAVAVASSVALTFAASLAASLLIRAVEARAVNPVDGAMPPAWVLARALGVGLLIALTYGSLGLLLGTICRSAAGGIAAALVWTVLLEPNLYGLGLDTGSRALHAIVDLFPEASAITLSGIFGTPGGGATSQAYLPVHPTTAAWALAGYTAVFLGLTLVLWYRRDVLTSRVARRRRRLNLAPTPVGVPAAPAAAADRVLLAGPSPARAGVLASLRAELLVMRHRPAVLALVLAMPVNMLIISYVSECVSYLTAGSGGSVTGVNATQLLPYLLPGQYLANVLSGFSIGTQVYGPAVFFLLGALVAGSEWGRRTIAAALLVGPRRVQVRIGQDLAVLLAAGAGVILTFLLAAAATTALAAGLAAPPLYNQFPPAAHLAIAVAGALTVALASTAIGLALGTILRSATKAAGVVLLWAVIIEPQLISVSTQLHGAWLRLYELLPDVSINTLVNLYNTTAAPVPGTSLGPPFGVQVTPALAFVTLGLYAAVSLAIAALITTRRDIT
jgi:ABC-2 type transport system permease protein